MRVVALQTAARWTWATLNRSGRAKLWQVGPAGIHGRGAVLWMPVRCLVDGERDTMTGIWQLTAACGV